MQFAVHFRVHFAVYFRVYFRVHFAVTKNGRKNKPEYAERAVLEAMVNHFIHRDYTVMGGEVHLDIYDDRLAVTSPGGMYNGLTPSSFFFRRAQARCRQRPQ